ncbi:unnamed protein product [Closterium sp. NIES-65]|nr:unnamed protein product [Closterium sp. NIES-65]
MVGVVGARPWWVLLGQGHGGCCWGKAMVCVVGARPWCGIREADSRWESRNEGGAAGGGTGEAMGVNGGHHLVKRRPASKYRYDEWDEELDRGRVKKVKRKADGDAPDPMGGRNKNPFQELSAMPAGAAGGGGGGEGGREAHGKRLGRWMGRDKGKHDSNRHVAKLRGKKARPRW